MDQQAEQIEHGWWLGTLGRFPYETDFAIEVRYSGDALAVELKPAWAGTISAGVMEGDTLSFFIVTDPGTWTVKGKFAGDSLELSFQLGHREVPATLRRLQSGERLPQSVEGDRRDSEQWSPILAIIDPGPFEGPSRPPGGAIILFDGSDLEGWMARDGGPARWSMEDGAMVAVPGEGDISTREKFGDYQLHLDWRIPQDVCGSGQGRGNSGLFLQDATYEIGRGGIWYEIQILDSFNNPTYVNGQAAALYKQAAPLTNAMRPPGEWNSFDVTYRAPRFNAAGTSPSADGSHCVTMTS